jgi:hypothetical protein
MREAHALEIDKLKFYRDNTTRLMLGALALVILLGALVYLGQGLPSEILLATVIVLGVSILLLFLFILASAFSMFGLTDPKQALGLPEGSIRALIALLLVMLFSIIGIYLYRSVSTTTTVSLTGLTSAQVADLGDRAVSIQPVAGGTFNVVAQSGANTEGVRLAQQLISMVGTLVVAVAGFYFGSRTADSGTIRDLTQNVKDTTEDAAKLTDGQRMALARSDAEDAVGKAESARLDAEKASERATRAASQADAAADEAEQAAAAAQAQANPKLDDVNKAAARAREQANLAQTAQRAAEDAANRTGKASEAVSKYAESAAKTATSAESVVNAASLAQHESNTAKDAAGEAKTAAEKAEIARAAAEKAANQAKNP